MIRQTTTALVLGAMAIGVCAEEVGREGFAYEVPIAVQEEGSVYRVPLIADVYKAVTRQDFGDMRVFNAAGEAVPHGLSRPTADPAKTMAALPVFPIPVKATQATPDVSLQVERGKDGSIVKLRTRSGSTADGIIYLVDASRTEDPLVALEFDWKAADASGFIGSLQVEESADLKSWRVIGQGALASLARDGQLLEQRRIPLPHRRAKYLRLAWVDPGINVRITSVKAELRPQAELQRDWLVVVGKPADKEGEYIFDVEGKMPVDRVRVLLPTNSVARISILARAKGGDPWLRRGEKTVYVLADPRGELKDNEISLSSGAIAREWLLRLQRQSSGDAGAAPNLELGWIPHQLVFVARGAAPYSLAYGRAGTVPVDYGVDELVRRSKREDAERVEIRAATLGTPYMLRGEQARLVPWYRGDWKQWLLWTVLVSGVVVLGYFAWRLTRQLGTNSSRK